MKILKKIVAFLVMSFAGGFSAIVFLSYFDKTKSLVPVADQAISIANTYIVFTTFIFVAFTVLLTIVCYVLAQSYSTHTKTLHNEAVENIRDCIGSDDEKAEKILTSMLGSALIQSHLTRKINALIERELSAKISERKQSGESQLAEVGEMQGWLQDSDENRGINRRMNTPFKGPMSHDEVDAFRTRSQDAGGRGAEANKKAHGNRRY